MKVKVVNYSQGPVNINNDLWNNGNNSINESVSLRTQLRYASKSDYIGIQLDLEIAYEKSPVVTLGFLVGFEVEGWSEKINEGWNPETDRKPLYQLCTNFWEVATGVVAALTTTSRKTGFVLPPIDENSFAEKLTLIRS